MIFSEILPNQIFVYRDNLDYPIYKISATRTIDLATMNGCRCYDGGEVIIYSELMAERKLRISACELKERLEKLRSMM